MIDPVEHQVHVRFPKGVPRGANMDAVVYDLLDGWLRTGRTKKKYAELVDVRWRNPARKTPEGRAWRSARHPEQSFKGARATLGALRRAIHLRTISFREVRSGE